MNAPGGALVTTLAMIVRAMGDAVDPWWIIGSAAVSLHCPDSVAPADVDMLLSERDAAWLLQRLALVDLAGDGSPAFRSAIFARWTTPPLTVELMAGFRFHDTYGWRDVQPTTRHAIEARSGVVVFVPAREELAALLLGFGRPKDRAHAALLAPTS